ncbi:MAG TPA: hypothetical protein DHN33_08125 [Eubacteriaceae bacterium]|nr:hypothetical protein [Eubacteriaceae bacterium]
MEQREADNLEEIDLKQLWFMLKNNYLWIVNFALVAIILASIFSFFIADKQYESYTTLMLGKPRDYQSESASSEITQSDIQLNQALVDTYSEIVKSRVVTSRVIEELDLQMTTDNLAQMVTVNTVNNTEIIQITVRSTDPILSAQIANQMATTFSNYVSDLMQIDNINVVDAAVASNQAVEPRTRLNIVIAAVLGLMLGVFFVFVREYLDTRIKTPDEVSALSKYPVLSVIPKSDSLNQGGNR